jgi:GAF domain-containing protein
MKGDHIVRGIVLLRRSPGQFDDRVVNLLTALASQSKVAIENARLFSEIEIRAGRSRRRTATGRVSHNMSHELPPLNDDRFLESTGSSLKVTRKNNRSS